MSDVSPGLHWGWASGFCRAGGRYTSSDLWNIKGQRSTGILFASGFDELLRLWVSIFLHIWNSSFYGPEPSRFCTRLYSQALTTNKKNNNTTNQWQKLTKYLYVIYLSIFILWYFTFVLHYISEGNTVLFTPLQSDYNEMGLRTEIQAETMAWCLLLDRFASYLVVSYPQLVVLPLWHRFVSLCRHFESFKSTF